MDLRNSYLVNCQHDLGTSRGDSGVLKTFGPTQKKWVTHIVCRDSISGAFECARELPGNNCCPDADAKGVVHNSPGQAPWVNRPKDTASAESAIHSRDEAGPLACKESTSHADPGLWPRAGMTQAVGLKRAVELNSSLRAWQC